MLPIVSGRSLAVLLGLGGIAMAQDGLVVDPWQRVVSALTAPTPASHPANDRTGVRPVGTASFAVEETKPGPAVVPLGPPLSMDAKAIGVVPIGPVTSGELVDPWRASVQSGRPPSEHPTLARGTHSDWAHEIDEIVDPWKRGPLAAFTDPIIVDPWAR